MTAQAVDHLQPANSQPIEAPQTETSRYARDRIPVRRPAFGQSVGRCLGCGWNGTFLSHSLIASQWIQSTTRIVISGKRSSTPARERPEIARRRRVIVASNSSTPACRLRTCTASCEPGVPMRHSYCMSIAMNGETCISLECLKCIADDEPRFVDASRT